MTQIKGVYNATAPTVRDRQNEDIQLDASGNLKTTIATDIPFAQKVTTGSGVTYIAFAPVGSLQSSAVWQAKKITVSGADTVITWAGGGLFNQVATDLTALSYS